MPALTFPYLGRPGDMRRLPSPNGAVTVTPVEAQVATLLSGGVAVASRLDVRRAFGLPYEWLPAVDADLLRGFHLRLFGRGPFVFVDPAPRNVLGFDVSSCGARSNAAHGWAASTGTLTRTTGAPAGAPNSGVLAWTGLAASATLQPAFAATSAPVVLPLEAVTVSLWAKASASVSVSWRVSGLDAAGAVVSTTPAATATVGTAWTQLTVTATAGAVAGVYLLPTLVLPASGLPTSVSVAAAQVEYNTTRTAWQPGHGAPRVLPVPGSNFDVPQIDTAGGAYYNETFTVAET